MSDPAPPPSETPPELPPKPMTPAQRLAAFHEQLRPHTPRLWVTYAIIAANVAVWIAQVATGVNAMSPTTDALIRWGADYGPRTVTAHEWWRLVTNTFLHIGLFHLAMNMIVLVSIGRFVERLVGNAGFLVLYLFAGIGGSCLSLAHNSFIVSAGASGAVFGLYGALLGFLLRARGTIPRDVLIQLRNSAVAFLLYNFVYGLSIPGIDQAAHLGGLFAGFLGGLALGHPIDADTRARRPRRILGLALGGLMLYGGVVAALPHPVDWQGEVQKFASMEERTVELVNASVKKNQDGSVSNAELGHLLAGVVPEWRTAGKRFAALEGLPALQTKLRDQLTEYIAARADGWQLISDGLDTNDTALIAKGGQKVKLSDELAKKIGK